MDGQNVSLALAFAGGFLSFASPCVLPLVPAYLGYLGGGTVAGLVADRKAGVLHSLAFVAGFSLVFVTLGASVGVISSLLSRYLVWVQRIGGLVLIVFGLHTLGLLQIPFLYADTRAQPPYSRSRGQGVGAGYVSSFLMGVFFSAGWAPCVGPILTAILLLASNTQTAAQGALLLFVYALGLGVPFVLAGLAVGSLTAWIRRMGRYMQWVSWISGFLLILIGVAIFTDSLRLLSAYGSFFNLGIQ
ncbi:MAG: cytochrome c biogenesis CcdA family protein [Anaerolineae bacterium]